MRQIVGTLLIGLVLCLSPGQARGQIGIGGPVTPYRTPSYFSPPGYYGTSYGTASYGLRQTYSTFASPYGPGYAYGYPPTSYLPGRHGVGLWAPASVSQPYLWRTPYYGTYAIPSAPANIPPPPIGVYAPGFGPGIPPRVYWR